MAVGDTASDMQAGVRAGAGRRVGVLTGTDDAARLEQSGATDVVGSVVDVPRLGALARDARARAVES